MTVVVCRCVGVTAYKEGKFWIPLKPQKKQNKHYLSDVDYSPWE